MKINPASFSTSIKSGSKSSVLKRCWINWRKGFTLIELLVVMAILGILAAATIVAVNPVKNINQAKDANVKSDMAQIAHAILVYATNNPGIYPPDLQTLATSGDINPLPKQPEGTDYGYQRSSACDSTECSCVLWGKLYNAPAGSIWCWASGTNSFKQSSEAPASDSTSCP